MRDPKLAHILVKNEDGEAFVAMGAFYFIAEAGDAWMSSERTPSSTRMKFLMRSEIRQDSALSRCNGLGLFLQ